LAEESYQARREAKTLISRKVKRKKSKVAAQVDRQLRYKQSVGAAAGVPGGFLGDLGIRERCS